MSNHFGPARRARRLVAGAAVGAALLVLGACSSSTDTAVGGAAPSTAAGTVATVGSASGGTVPGTVPSGGTDASAAMAFPGTDWVTADPASLGFDPAALDALSTEAGAGGSNCLLVTRDGKIVEESYFNGATATAPQEVWSATKSYSSTLVGIAQDEGKLSIDDLATEYIPEWAGTPSDTVTVRDILSNDSGRHYDYETDYLKMAGGAQDKTQFAIDLGQDAPPGTVWKYNNSAIQTLSQVLEKATGEQAADYAQEKLLGPIGMTASHMTKDPAGNTLTFMGLQSTCRDMARFGLLMLNQGNWDGKQIVSEAWVDEATGHASQDLNGSYGFLWWLNREGPIAADDDQATTGAEDTAPPQVGQMVPGAADDVYWALGLGGQIIAIYPETGVVAVRLAPTKAPEGSAPYATDTLTVGTQAALVDP